MAFGDHAAFVMASAQIDEARRRRATWEVLHARQSTPDQQLTEPVTLP